MFENNTAPRYVLGYFVSLMPKHVDGQVLCVYVLESVSNETATIVKSRQGSCCTQRIHILFPLRNLTSFSVKVSTIHSFTAGYHTTELRLMNK